ncbi:MAG UNVERIFIED_CONTAM: hypothetical protein LVT10_20620 [Anaerolineae bacterium]
MWNEHRRGLLSYPYEIVPIADIGTEIGSRGWGVTRSTPHGLGKGGQELARDQAQLDARLWAQGDGRVGGDVLVQESIPHHPVERCRARIKIASIMAK